jgi:hypothetical protein
MELAYIAQQFGVEDVIVLDTEYVPTPGFHVRPVCLCAMSVVTGRQWRVSGRPLRRALC